MSIAEDLYMANSVVSKMEEIIYEKLLTIFGADLKDSNTWLIDDMDYDWYDNSLVITGVPIDLEVSEDRLNKVWEMDFGKLYVKYLDGTQKCYLR